MRLVEKKQSYSVSTKSGAGGNKLAQVACWFKADQHMQALWCLSQKLQQLFFKGSITKKKNNNNNQKALTTFFFWVMRGYYSRFWFKISYFDQRLFIIFHNSICLGSWLVHKLKSVWNIPFYPVGHSLKWNFSERLTQAVIIWPVRLSPDW